LIVVRGCSLYIGGLKASSIAEEFGTPLYVYDEDTVARRAEEVLSSTRGVVSQVLYSLKANPNPYIAHTLYSMGLGLEAVSPGEVILAVRLGADPSRIMFTGSSVSLEDLEIVLGYGVEVNVDSASAARKLCRLGYRGAVGVRVNPRFGAGYHRYTVTGGRRVKFGVAMDELRGVVEELRSCGIAVKRLHAHMGSGISDPGMYLELLKLLVRLAREVGGIEELDLGGGFAVPYRRGDPRFPWRLFSEMLRSAVEELEAGEYRLIIEPGRYLVAESGVLLARVTDVKVVDGVFIAGTDTGMNHLIRPALYGAYHEAVLADRMCEEASAVVDIVGNLCESGDVLAQNRHLPPPREGDVVAILNAGAYGISMASNYNMRPLPPEVVVDRARRAILVRRRQGFEKLLENFVWWP